MPKPRRMPSSKEKAPIRSTGIVEDDTVSPRWLCAVSSGVLGWVLDAFDFFILVFLLDVLAARFHTSKGAIVATITATLVMRPLGALFLGSLADRFGRRKPLIACVLYFSIITALTPFAPNYTIFLLLRSLYGIGMGGYWGIGASMVMESSPRRWRGLFSGIMQAGYSVGYLLAALAMQTIKPRFGWQWMFLSGLVLAIVIAILTLSSSEPAAWRNNHVLNTMDIVRSMRPHIREFLSLTMLMTIITCLSHGTQDLYPDFLKSTHGFSSNATSNIAIVYNIGAVFGALVIGRISDRLGRRKSIRLALAICLISIPAWAFGSTVGVLVAGSFILQFGVQGAFGVIPAHLNEMSPGNVRGLFPGLVYQLGVLIGAPCVILEYALRSHFGYRGALALFEIVVILLLFLLLAFGSERHGRNFFLETNSDSTLLGNRQE